jgi:hypothetical protein
MTGSMAESFANSTHSKLCVRTTLCLFGLAIGVQCPSTALSQSARKSKKNPFQNSSPLGGSSSSTSSPGQSQSTNSNDPLGEEGVWDSSDSAAVESESNSYLKTGGLALDLSFPNGGSAWKEGVLAARYLLSTSSAVFVGLSAQYEKEQKNSNYGALVGFQSYFSAKGRTLPFLYASLGVGQSNEEDKSGKKKNTLSGGVSLGAGLEVFLLAELSLSARTGLAFQVLPSDKTQVATGTSQVQLSFYLQ